MKHDDSIMIQRTSQIKDPITHIAKTSNETFGPYNGRLGRASGGLTQVDATNTYVQNSRIYIPDITANIKKGDILVLNDVSKYIVDNVYCPNRHHLEIDVIYKGDV